MESLNPITLKYTKRFTIREKKDIAIYSRGIWSPTARAWRDIIEDYLYISRKRMKNKLAIFKLQLAILTDLIGLAEIVDQHKKELKKIEEQKTGENEPEGIDEDIKNIKSEIFIHELIITVLKEIVDGLAWRYFRYNRAFLYILADKQSSGFIRPDKGLVNALYEYADIFLKPDELAILNDITNFLKVGDITTIKNDGSIELVEVKSGDKSGRGRRITRQKERMEEIVDFFNTGISEYDGKKIKIIESPVKQKHYLGLLLETIRNAKAKGFHSELIGEYMIIECTDFTKIKDSNNVTEYFKSRHRTIRDKWKKEEDIVLPVIAIEKLAFSKNIAPFSVFPFDNEICADILCGSIFIQILLNYSEIMRLFQRAGWNIVDSIFFKKPDEIKSLDPIKTYMMVIEKKGFTIHVPPGMLVRLHYEFLSPKTLIEEFERLYTQGPQKDYELSLTNFSDEERVWD